MRLCLQRHNATALSTLDHTFVSNQSGQSFPPPVLPEASKLSDSKPFDLLDSSAEDSHNDSVVSTDGDGPRIFTGKVVTKGSPFQVQ